MRSWLPMCSLCSLTYFQGQSTHTSSICPVTNMHCSVPRAALMDQFVLTVEKISTTMQKHLDSPNVLRPALLCLFRVLGAQRKVVWRDSNVKQMFQSLLVYTVDSRPKVTFLLSLSLSLFLSIDPFHGSHATPCTHRSGMMPRRDCLSCFNNRKSRFAAR